jgi:serine/threonine protein phosphatase 1
MTFRWPFSQPTYRSAAIPPDERVYAIGDIHGEAALFAILLARIEQDSLMRGSAHTRIILLGDIIDRGARSADLVSVLMRTEDARLMVLKGNHEAALVDAYRGDEQALGFWLHFGGIATLRSFGFDEGEDIAAFTSSDLLSIVHEHIAEDIIDWLDGLPLKLEVGDYFFTHAGIRPGVALARQSVDDLLWIREPFLSSRRDHGKVIVHGHTIDTGPVALGGTRIGLDTGACDGGRLTALGLQANDQWIIEASDEASAADGG